eukprot:scaffold264749_cov19-Tisochrysis_lutea.AAC.4
MPANTGRCGASTQRERSQSFVGQESEASTNNGISQEVPLPYPAHAGWLTLHLHAHAFPPDPPAHAARLTPPSPPSPLAWASWSGGLSPGVQVGWASSGVGSAQAGTPTTAAPAG